MPKIMKTMTIAFMVSLALCAGCRTKGDVDGTEGLTSEILPNDIGLDERFDVNGVRVPASEFSVDAVLFAYDSFRLNPVERHKLTKVAGFMKRDRSVKLIVEGHCDERGSREYNISLGEHRALAIRSTLISDEGIDSKRIQTRSYGEEKPVSFAHNESSWRKNRRGEFALFR